MEYIRLNRHYVYQALQSLCDGVGTHG
jgi:hypothetical protein